MDSSPICLLVVKRDVVRRVSELLKLREIAIFSSEIWACKGKEKSQEKRDKKKARLLHSRLA